MTEKGQGELTHRNLAKTTSYESRLRLLDRVSKDKLTQALNRDAIESYMQELIKNRENFAIVFTDGDHFKKVNDSFGHDAGDEVLKVTIQRVKSKISENKGDAVGRWGGDEIMVIFKGINNEEIAKRRAEEIRIAFSSKPIVLEDIAKSVDYTISVGVAVSREGLDIQTLTKIADKNCYLAKRLGGDMVITESEAVKYFI